MVYLTVRSNTFSQSKLQGSHMYLKRGPKLADGIKIKLRMESVAFIDLDLTTVEIKHIDSFKNIQVNTGRKMLIFPNLIWLFSQKRNSSTVLKGDENKHMNTDLPETDLTEQ